MKTFIGNVACVAWCSVVLLPVILACILFILWDDYKAARHRHPDDDDFNERENAVNDFQARRKF